MGLLANANHCVMFQFPKVLKKLKAMLLKTVRILKRSLKRVGSKAQPYKAETNQVSTYIE